MLSSTISVSVEDLRCSSYLTTQSSLESRKEGVDTTGVVRDDGRAGDPVAEHSEEGANGTTVLPGQSALEVLESVGDGSGDCQSVQEPAGPPCLILILRRFLS